MLKAVSDGIMEGKSMKQAMLDANYSESYANSSTHLRETKAWKALLKTQLKDEKLISKVNKLLDHKEWRANDSGLTHAFKLKGSYEPDKHEHKIEKRRSIAEIEAEITDALSEIGELI